MIFILYISLNIILLISNVDFHFTVHLKYETMAKVIDILYAVTVFLQVQLIYVKFLLKLQMLYKREYQYLQYQRANCSIRH